MAAARKIPGKTATVKRGAKHKGAKRQPVKVTLPPVKPAPSTDLLSEPPGFLIVGIGASAGGLEAMEEFFRHMPPISGMAFVVVSHQHAGHVSLLPSLLSKCTVMPVVEAKDGMEVEANGVYMAPGGTNLAILHGILHFMEPPRRIACRCPSITSSVRWRRIRSNEPSASSCPGPAATAAWGCERSRPSPA